MLGRYYEGLTTYEEKAILTEFFVNTDPKKLPADLKGDHHLFAGLHALHGIDDNTDVPPELESRIKDFFDWTKVEELRQPKMKWVRIRRVVPIAAAIALLVLIGVSVVKISRPSQLEENQPMVAMTETIINVEDTTLECTPQLLATTVEVNEEPTERITPKAQEHKTEVSVAEVDRKPYRRSYRESYREVTDVDEATAITRQVLNLLALGTTEATTAIADVDSYIEYINQEISNI